ncbi:O-antigen ligase family protein [Bacteroidota bacterium]
MYFLVIRDQFILSLFPLAFVLIIAAIYSFDKLFLFTVFIIPLSIPLKEFVPGLEFDMYLPTEPLIVGMLIIFIIKLFIDKSFDRKIFKHPVSLAIGFNLIWILFTTLTSTMPLISIKFFLARFWFVIVFYFIGIQLFQKKENIKKFIWLYILGFLIVIGITISKHLSYGLVDQEAAHFVMDPFFNDHTSYAAVLSMFIPVLIGFIFLSKAKFRLLITIVTFAFIFALVFSYTRAAWISLVGGFCIWVVIFLKIKLRTVLIGLGILIGLFVAYSTIIMTKMESNEQDSSTNFGEHIQSMSNISTDASNLERINRWSCALRMFSKKPVFGFGPGTYMFQYAPFQKQSQKTIISTNYGDGGNAHSEYLGPLSESGVLGLISFLLIVITSVYYGIKVYRKNKSKEFRWLAITLVIGLFTYYLHGIMNNFLDTDKASAPFWGFIAIIVAMDIYHNNSEKIISKKKSAITK